jgi:hypothetical protein
MDNAPVDHPALNRNGTKAKKLIHFKVLEQLIRIQSGRGLL